MDWKGSWWLFVAGVVLIAPLLWRKLGSKPPPLFDGPWPLPILGNVGTLMRLRKDPDGELLRLRQRWGDVCMLWFGPNPVLVISSARVAKELLNDRSSTYSSRPRQNHFRDTLWPWRLVSMPAGEDFRFVRRLYNNYLNAQGSLMFRKYQDYESISMLMDLMEHPDNFLRSAERYTMSLMFSVVHGVRLESLDHPILVEFNDIWDVEMKYFEPGTLPIDYLPILQKLPLALKPWQTKLVSLVGRESELHLSFLQTLREAVNEGRAPDCFAKLLLETQEREGVSEEMAVHILAMLIGAGSDTTASVLQGVFKIMALNPDATRMAQEEIDRVVGPDRLPEWSDELQLPYLKCFVKEVHRVGLIGSLGIPHCATQDDVYQGRFIPKGAIVFPSLPALSTDPERYDESDRFEPQRFHEDQNSAAASAKNKDYTKRDHFHYGFGRRMCPGIFVAEASLFIVISRLLWAFNVAPKPGYPLDMKDRRMILVWKHNPYQVDITVRRPEQANLIKDALKKMDTGALSFDDVIQPPK